MEQKGPKVTMAPRCRIAAGPGLYDSWPWQKRLAPLNGPKRTRSTLPGTAKGSLTPTGLEPEFPAVLSPCNRLSEITDLLTADVFTSTVYCTPRKGAVHPGDKNGA